MLTERSLPSSLTMAILAHIPADPSVGRSAVQGVLVIKATDEGWALVGQEGEAIFEAGGLEGRQACLNFAHEHGVLALISKA